MLTENQLTKLNAALRREDLPDNPLIRLMTASKYAELSFDEVLDHLIRKAILNAQRESSYVQKQDA